jgi:hypothetical protein
MNLSPETLAELERLDKEADLFAGWPMQCVINHGSNIACLRGALEPTYYYAAIEEHKRRIDEMKRTLEEDFKPENNRKRTLDNIEECKNMTRQKLSALKDNFEGFLRGCYPVDAKSYMQRKNEIKDARIKLLLNARMKQIQDLHKEVETARGC